MNRIVRYLLLCLSLVGACGLACSASFAADLASEARLRHPTALAFTLDGKYLLAANSASGSISVVDFSQRQVAQRQVVAEIEVGTKLSDLTAIGNDLFLATDESAHRLILLQWADQSLVVRQRLTVSPYPVEIVFSGTRSRAYVASLWSRRLTVVQLAVESPAMHVAKVVDLDFPPRKMTLVNEGQSLLIADAFVGLLSVYDPATDAVSMSRSFFGHNVRGLTPSADGRMLLIGHQMLNELAHTVHNDVHWGLLMSNDLRWLRLDALLDPDAVLYAGGHMHPVGEANDAAADPSEVAVAPNGTAVVALSGVNQIGVGRETDFRLQRYQVGRRPTAVVIAPDGNTAVIANTFDDTISLFEIDSRKETARIRLGRQGELTLAEQGEQLFYDGSLSLEGWMSCHSCHTDAHSGGMLNDNLSDGSFGASKRVLSLLGAADTAPYAWNGKVATLEEQIARSVNSTMQSSHKITDTQTASLAAYLRTLKLPASLAELRGTADPAAIARGRQHFAAQGCVKCHAPPHYTTPKAYDVGIHDKLGNQRYNPPSLRGLSHRRAFFHDARAKQLSEVLETYGHGLTSDLNEEETADLLAFLQSL